MAKYVLSVDQSTQGTKGLLFDPSGKLIARADRPHRQIVNDLGYVEHDPKEILANTFAVCKDVILKAGIPIARTVRLIGDKMSDKTLKNILEQVAEDVEAGRSLSASFAERGKKILPLTFLETIHAGEEAGNLETAFESVSEHYTKQIKLKGKVRGAMIYPTFVLLLAVAVVIVLMVKVVPTFTAIFDEQGSELPAITMSLIVISNFFRKSWYYIVGIIAAVVVVVKL